MSIDVDYDIVLGDYSLNMLPQRFIWSHDIKHTADLTKKGGFLFKGLARVEKN